jgi:hypothetical protein
MCMRKEKRLSSRGFCPGCSIISPGVAGNAENCWKSPGNDPNPNNGKAFGVEEGVVGCLLPGEVFILLLLLLFCCCCCALGEDEEETGGVVVRVCLKSPPPTLPGDIIKLVIE